MIGFYFSGSDGKVQLPVNPEQLKIVRKGANQKAEIVKFGEINILRNAKLRTTGFDFLLPGADYYPFIVGEWKKPKFFTDYFDKTLEKGKSLRFTVSEIGINMRASVENFDYSYVAGDHESVICSIDFCEYKIYGAKVLYIPPKSVAKSVVVASRPSDKPKQATYTVKKGDTLWAISQKFLGSGSRYSEISGLNGVPNPNRIKPGQVFKIPSK